MQVAVNRGTEQTGDANSCRVEMMSMFNLLLDYPIPLDIL